MSDPILLERDLEAELDQAKIIITSIVEMVENSQPVVMFDADRLDDFLSRVMPLSEHLRTAERDQERILQLEDRDIMHFAKSLRSTGFIHHTFRDGIVDTKRAAAQLKEDLDKLHRGKGSREGVHHAQEKLNAAILDLAQDLETAEQSMTQIYHEFAKYQGNDNDWLTLCQSIAAFSKEEAERLEMSHDTKLQQLGKRYRNTSAYLQRRDNATALLSPFGKALQILAAIINEFKAVKQHCADKLAPLQQRIALSMKQKALDENTDPERIVQEIAEAIVEVENKVSTLLLPQLYTFDRGVGKSRKIVHLEGVMLDSLSLLYQRLRRNVQ